MNKLKNIIRIRISDGTKDVLRGKNLSKYIREAMIEKMERDFPEKFQCPF